ncbi:helix-turn-helix transcriptional regulator [Microbacterium sp.]|uniref:helix-turn-helix transcriptional regulator n=1 Tax=Microbacterium sp. TaxID=51671 RepID=UPI0039E593FF
MTDIVVTQLMTTEQLAEYLQIPVRTLEDWRSPRNNKGPTPIHLGKRVRYRLATVDAWLVSLEADASSKDAA